MATEGDANQPKEAELPPPVVAAQSHPHPCMIRNPAKTKDVESHETADARGNECPEPEIPSLMVAADPFPHPHMIRHPANSEEVVVCRNADSADVGGQQGHQVATRAIQHATETTPPQTDVNLGTVIAETTLEMQEGGCAWPEEVGVDKNQNQIVLP